MPLPAQKLAQPKIVRESHKDWLKGVVTAFDDGRTPADGLRSSGNVWLQQDGTVRPRPSLVRYGSLINTRSGAATVTTNLVINPSFETGITNWTAAGVGGTLTQDSTQFYSGTKSLKLATAGSGNQQATITISGLTIGASYTIQGRVRASTTAKDIYLQSSINGYGTFTDMLSTGGWDLLSVTITATNTSGTIEFGVFSNSDFINIDAVMMRTGTTLTSYFDGSSTTTTTTDYAWTGATGGSTSTQSVYAYGPAVLLGELFEFTKTQTTSTQNWLIGMFNVNGTTRPYVSKDGAAWQATIGKTYDNSASAHFVEIDEKVIIMNGTDNLSFLDVTTAGTTNTITAFTTLNPPTSPVATKTGLGGTTLTYYYRVTANSSYGETAETVAATVTVDRQREVWDSTTNFVTVTWTASSNATATTTYNVYVGVASGQEFRVAYGLNGTSYKDTGTDAQDVTSLAPAFDNTLGPKATRGTVINGQLFLTGDSAHPRYIWYGGTGTNVLDFSALNGGGYVEIGRGTKDIPVVVRSFRDHSGAPVITVLCQGTNGKGKRYTMTPSSLTVGTTTINFFDIQEDNGQAGTDSPDAVLFYNDSLWYPSRDGFKTTGTKPQLQNVLSTDTVSETILQDVINLNTAYMGKAVGLGYQQQLYFALPNGTTTNSEIWILDLQRGGAWMKPWNIAADWMTLYNDNSGVTHFLIVKNNIFYELTYASTTSDDGVAVPTNITSGIIKFSEDGMDWAKVIRLSFMLLRPQGNINITVTGKTEDAELQTVGSANVTPTSTVSGWGEAGWAGTPNPISPMKPKIFGWSDFYVVPVVIGSARYQVDIDIDEELQYYQWSIDTNTTGVDYQLSDVISQRVDIGVKDLS